MEREEREKLLGFSPQQEKSCNKYLPFTDQIDADSNRTFAEIKYELGRAVAQRDLKTGVVHWFGMLKRYIRLYGLKFSKEDHVSLVNLLYDLIIMPDQELGLIQKFATTVTTLLKKTELLSRDDLTLPWRPLYDIAENTLYSQQEHHGLLLLPLKFENDLKSLVKSCRDYFPLEATKEMLEEWRPLMCPFDVTNSKAIQYLEFFLPTNLPPHQQEYGFKLWFDELIEIWDSYHNTPTWEAGLVNLFARLAEDNIGYIDWSPWAPKIFNRFLRSFNLPVGTKALKVERSNNTYCVAASCLWIVSMLGGESEIQTYIDQMLNTLLSFYHPSNLGKWNLKLSALMMYFPKTFVKRVHRERYKKKTWENQIPDSHKLSEKDITRYVESMKPIVFTSMFSKSGSQDAAIAIGNLANLRPELIIPTLMEKLYPAMESLTEPHRLIACMNCVSFVVRPMLYSRKWYPDGRSHLLPLLNLCLPGIDPNDFKKSMVTFQMIFIFTALVPMFDCSGAVFVRTDLTEVERELCSATAQFEDFILQFLDRVFSLIENSAQDHVHGSSHKLNPEQSVMEVGLSATVTSVLQQCSDAIFESALRRINSFLVNNLYESKVGGRFAGNLCRAVMRVNPEKAVKLLFPYFAHNVKEMISSHEDILTEVELDDSFLWSFCMLPQISRGLGYVLLPYKDDVIHILKLTLHMKSKKGYETAGQLLRFTLNSLTRTCPSDMRSIPGSFDRPGDEYLAIEDWGKPVPKGEVCMKWWIPGEEELSFAQEIIDKILKPELDAIKSVTEDKPMEREELLRRLNVILECIVGGGVMMPMWEGEPIKIVDSQVPLTRQRNVMSVDNKFLTLEGQNIRSCILESIRSLHSHMVSSAEDDTKALFKLIKIYELVLMFAGVAKHDFDLRWKSFQVAKQAFVDRLRGKDYHVRVVHLGRINLQLEAMILHGFNKTFTQKHLDAVMDIFSLATSRYREVRRCAQDVLMHCFRNFQYSYRCLLPMLVKNIQDNEIPEHEFKGSLFILAGNEKRNFAIKRSWDVLYQVYPAIVQSRHSEKPSIIKLLDTILKHISNSLETFSIEIKTSKKVIEQGLKLAQSKTLPYKEDNSVSLTDGEKFEDSKNSSEKMHYFKLIDVLVSLIEGNTLTWKFNQIAIELLCQLLRCDVTISANVVNLFMKRIVHESLYIRKICIGVVAAILKQQKQTHKKIKVNPFKESGCVEPSDSNALAPGDRKDNQWICYDPNNLPDTKEKWERTVFIEKTHWGYYCWPKEMYTAAPAHEQPSVHRKFDELREGEKPIYQELDNEEFIASMLRYLSLEEQERKDKFKVKHMTMFKGIFRNFGDTFLDKFKPHVEKLITDNTHDQHDGRQRCALEILAGILRGSKHWPYEKVASLWEWALPLLKKAIGSITVETFEDWGLFFTHVSQSRDPRKIYWLLELVMEMTLNGDGSSFEAVSRLCAVQTTLIQQEWRVSALLYRLLYYLLPHLAHSYKNVRKQMGSLLSHIFLGDYKMLSNSQSNCPKRADFVQLILPKLESLKYTVSDDIGNGASNSSPQEESAMDCTDSAADGDETNGEDSERKMAIRLCKTVVYWITSASPRMYTSAPPELFPFLPIMCTLESESNDEELKAECNMALACFSQAYLQPAVVPLALNTVREVVGLQSWHARIAILQYLQVMVFCNFFTLCLPKYKEEVEEIVTHLICDERLEVREVAAVTLSGLVQCGYLSINDKMLSHFERLSLTKIARKKSLENLPVEALLKRHAGVLGLGAIVQAYPYDVPDFVPKILMHLSNHVNDPQPVQMTVKKILSNFRRTHYDSWHDHKQMFTDDQLVVLTDLLVSPNYYA